VIPTVLRPTLKDAFLSVFHQTFPGRVQVLIGIDRTAGDDRMKYLRERQAGPPSASQAGAVKAS